MHACYFEAKNDAVLKWMFVLLVFNGTFNINRLYRAIGTCTEVSGVENIGQCGRLSQLRWLLGAL